MPRVIPRKATAPPLPVNGHAEPVTMPAIASMSVVTPVLVSPAFPFSQRDDGDRLGVNCKDLVGPTVGEAERVTIARMVDIRSPVVVDRNVDDESCFVFICPLIDAAKMMDVLRNRDRCKERSVIRTYLSKAGGKWRKLPWTACLTQIRGREIILSIDLFRPPSVVVTMRAPARVVRLGSSKGAG